MPCFNNISRLCDFIRYCNLLYRAKSVHTIGGEGRPWVPPRRCWFLPVLFYCGAYKEDSQEVFLVAIKCVQLSTGCSLAENRKRSGSALKSSPLELYTATLVPERVRWVCVAELFPRRLLIIIVARVRSLPALTQSVPRCRGNYEYLWGNLRVEIDNANG